jgi:hypothetical protein
MMFNLRDGLAETPLPQAIFGWFPPCGGRAMGLSNDLDAAGHRWISGTPKGVKAGEMVGQEGTIAYG